MSARTAIIRAELALAALAATALLLATIVMVDALRFHLPLLVSGEHPAVDRHTVALTLLALAQAVVTWRAVRSLRRQRRVARRLDALPVVERRRVGPHAIAIVADPRPVAFCAGLRRPAVFVTTGALERLAPDELLAVVEHEAHHVRRRDPLRLLVAQTLADAFALPSLRDLPERQHATADLAADAAAVAAAGSPRPLAAAMLRLPDPRPERVDHLLGRPLAGGSRMLLGCTLVATGVLVATAVGLVVAPEDPALPALPLLVLAMPSLLACRRHAQRSA
ncbi:MAG TPA: M56 family metallopeptidase [Solirubrobacteraceae bacterium]|nr:M56 family metallopeptidase [Solirubrobacteraceae bacterium]